MSSSKGGRAKKPVRLNMDEVVHRFLSREFIVDPEGTISRDLLLQLAEQECLLYGVNMVSRQALGRFVRAVFPNLGTRRIGKRGFSRYHYIGIRYVGSHNVEAPVPNVEAPAINPKTTAHSLNLLYTKKPCIMRPYGVSFAERVKVASDALLAHAGDIRGVEAMRRFFEGIIDIIETMKDISVLENEIAASFSTACVLFSQASGNAKLLQCVLELQVIYLDRIEQGLITKVYNDGQGLDPAQGREILATPVSILQQFLLNIDEVPKVLVVPSDNNILRLKWRLDTIAGMFGFCRLYEGTVTDSTLADVLGQQTQLAEQCHFVSSMSSRGLGEALDIFRKAVNAIVNKGMGDALQVIDQALKEFEVKYSASNALVYEMQLLVLVWNYLVMTLTQDCLVHQPQSSPLFEQGLIFLGQYLELAIDHYCIRDYEAQRASEGGLSDGKGSKDGLMGTELRKSSRTSADMISSRLFYGSGEFLPSGSFLG